ncbi:alpha/beta fold hydrolase [Stutzerimonas stutzeri]|uniref:alpha/beta fold hydrolase n=1 Tax=Stutzerimonas stutzeri TaxID=316 RepID=UPI001909F6AC|nr:alpha/beta hydrolase [Stutzerimonas stutzeri]MBK3805862.1 alpha/beta fold hydrolase [Stutzerimonas stutzeri]MBK3853675.1 alpha/beta fold hydrolase [Stutzerimonas stutzeri]MDH0214270.1 alpha/beta hydrolase [Stutzerimonas stutzeri]MDH0261620.1 alpha/beta hydrolase [Stutzerimonas stutzeri]MDH0503931.1 alpha/beta hydrolase [Stutzerimonas stutzeri]
MNPITRTLAMPLLAIALQPAFAAQAAQPAKPGSAAVAAHTASTITTADGVQLYYKDWGPKDGPVVTFSHGWPLSSDSWESQMLFLASEGYRVVAHDRRGHGRSSQPWEGNDMDHYADDLAAVIDALDLQDVTLVGFSTGGGEVARYIGRHGTGRVKKAVLVSAVPPMMLRTEDNPDGLPLEVFDGIRKASLEDRAQLYLDLASGPFYGFNRPGAKVSQGLIDNWRAQGMQAGHKNTYDSIAAFSATDFREDLKKFDVPTLVIHGDDDQIVPLDISGKASAAQIKDAKLIVYPGAPHGLTDTHKARFNQDLLDFLRK